MWRLGCRTDPEWLSSAGSRTQQTRYFLTNTTKRTKLLRSEECAEGIHWIFRLSQLYLQIENFSQGLDSVVGHIELCEWLKLLQSCQRGDSVAVQGQIHQAWQMLQPTGFHSRNKVVSQTELLEIFQRVETFKLADAIVFQRQLFHLATPIQTLNGGNFLSGRVVHKRSNRGVHTGIRRWRPTSTFVMSLSLKEAHFKFSKSSRFDSLLMCCPSSTSVVTCWKRTKWHGLEESGTLLGPNKRFSATLQSSTRNSRVFCQIVDRGDATTNFTSLSAVESACFFRGFYVYSFIARSHEPNNLPSWTRHRLAPQICLVCGDYSGARNAHWTVSWGWQERECLSWSAPTATPGIFWILLPCAVPRWTRTLWPTCRWERPTFWSLQSPSVSDNLAVR